MITRLCVIALFLGFTKENAPLKVLPNFPISEHEKKEEKVELKTSAKDNWEQFVFSNYECLGDSSLTYEAFYNGLKGYYALKEKDVLTNDDVMTIVDFSQHSSKERMYIIDMNSFEVLNKSLCSHGKNTGGAMATKFSNTNGSLQSSLGFYLTAETYSGKFDYAMRLDGLEKSNSRARERGIVVHGANYATPDFLERNRGVLGRSFGCPALPKEDATELIDVIKEGTCFFIYTNDLNYLESSEVIKKFEFDELTVML